MKNAGAEIKVGLFVLAGIIILTYMSVKVGKFDFGKKKGYEIFAYFDNASGLNIDVPVEIAGIEVGRVEDIGLERRKAKITMRIAPDTSIPSDSKAFIRTKGVLGDKFIQIIPGKPESPPIKDGERIVDTYTPTDIDQLINRIGEVALDVRKVSRSLGNVLGGKEGEDKMRQILDNITTSTASLNRIIGDNEKRISALLINFSEFSKDIKDVSHANKEYINRIVIDIKETTTQLKEAVEAFSMIAKKIERGEGTLGRLIHDTTTIEDLNETLASLKRVSEKIDAGKGTIGKLINDEKMAEDLGETVTGIRDYFARMDAFRFDIDFHGEYLTRNNDTKYYLNLKIQPKADKYYLLGLVSDPAGVETVTDTTITETPGGTRTVHQVKRERDKLKFNAQIAKRYYDLVLRGGIIESTGGIGLDYYLFGDRFKLSLEAFDFNIDRAAHLKGGVDFTFFKYLYLTAGFDDFLNDEGNSSFFIGAGLRFEDDDIKYLLTSVPIPGQ
jgi:phospholipid/cholesterol/gamma-HCH transport system substrate-binding protein